MNDNGGWPVWQTLLLGAAGIGLAFVLVSWLAPAAFECPPFDKTHPTACSEIIRNNGLAVAGLFAGLVGLVALHLNARRTQTDRLRLTNDTYVKAIEQLSSASMEVRIGAMYALERIADEEQRYHWPIIETLAAYIRERAPWPERGTEEAKGLDAVAAAIAAVGGAVAQKLPGATTEQPAADAKPAGSPEQPDETGTAGEDGPRRAPTDIQTALTIIAQRSARWRQAQPARWAKRATRFALRIKTWSEHRLAKVSRAQPLMTRLQKALATYGATADGGEPRQVDLRHANLRHADLRNAYLSQALLEGAHLGDTNLGDANLWGANLTGAYLRGAYLRGAYLRGAYLTGANLGFADLRGAYLGGANLTGANLRRAHFSKHPSELGAIWDEAYPPTGLDSIIIDDT